MKKPVKIKLVALAAFIGLVIITLTIVPIVLKDRVATLVRNELNERPDSRRRVKA